MNYQAKQIDRPREALAAQLDVSPFIGGARVRADDAAAIAKVNPADRSENPSLLDCGADLAREAAASAREAFAGRWGATPPADRKAILLEGANLVRKASEELAHLDCMEMGKPISASRGDAHVAATFLQYYAEALDKNYGATAPGAKGFLETQIYEPRGVVAAIIPWNFPIINAALKAGPALAAGNAIVLKPSEYGGYSSLRFAEIMKEAGLPDGALNVVTGAKGTAEALVTSSNVDLVSFTGSTSTGRAVMRAAASEHLRPVMLECGGKSPQIVFADAYRSEGGRAIAMMAAQMAMWNSGQVCVARSRLLVERSVYDAVTQEVLEICAGMKVGDPFDPSTQLGPLAFQSQYENVLQSVERGAAEGAALLLDGRAAISGAKGFHIGPTIFADAASSPSIWRDEIFGPVLSIAPFDDAEEAIKLANESEYGLAATVWTTDLSRAHRMADAINAGTVTVMTRAAPPDGCWPAHAAEPAGQSGFGVEGGMAALRSYSRLKSRQFIY